MNAQRDTVAEPGSFTSWHSIAEERGSIPQRDRPGSMTQMASLQAKSGESAELRRVTYYMHGISCIASHHSLRCMTPLATLKGSVRMTLALSLPSSDSLRVDARCATP